MSSHDQILDAARAEVCRVGVSALTLAQVARRSGISRATMYRRFASRDGLIGALIADELDRLERLLIGRLRFSDAPRDTVYMIVREVLAANAANTALQAALRIDGAALLPLLVRSGPAPTLVDVVTERALAHIAGSPLAESLRPDPPAAVEFLVTAVYGQLLSPARHLSDAQIAEAVCAAVLDR